MNEKGPINQTKLFGLDKFMYELVRLYNNDVLPNKILLSGQKGLGKSTLALHLINYILSEKEEFTYDINNFKINTKNSTFKTILNKSNTNLIIVDINQDKKIIDINQIRELITNLNKSSFNNKPRFILIDNIEFLNVNSINALLKVLEEPNKNIHFILINNNKKILKTLLSRCINFKISLSNNECLDIADKLLDNKLNEIMNKDLINYYSSPGNIYNIANFGMINNYDLITLDLKSFLNILIKENHYKKDNLIKYLIFDLIEFYFRKINLSLSSKIYDKYSYFLKRISDTRTFNLDDESLFVEFEEEILNG
jgi:DNA polymerase III subunit delta'